MIAAQADYRPRVSGLTERCCDSAYLLFSSLSTSGCKRQGAYISIGVALSFKIDLEDNEVAGRAGAKAAAGGLVTIDANRLPGVGRSYHRGLTTTALDHGGTVALEHLI